MMVVTEKKGFGRTNEILVAYIKLVGLTVNAENVPILTKERR